MGSFFFTTDHFCFPRDHCNFGEIRNHLQSLKSGDPVSEKKGGGGRVKNGIIEEKKHSSLRRMQSATSRLKKEQGCFHGQGSIFSNISSGVSSFVNVKSVVHIHRLSFL